MPPYESLPYRPCAGITVFNRAGLVFVGRRSGGVEHVDAMHVWQMPQGGLDRGEDPYAGALRELYEETNISSVDKIGEIKEWIAYDIPREIVGEAWGGKYRGQKQKWLAFRFTGDESEIDLERHAEIEFDAWRWGRLDEAPALIVPFKRAAYEQVVQAFAGLVV